MNKPNLEDKKFKQTINMIPEENLPINFNLHWHKFVEIISFPDSRPTFCQIIRACEEGKGLSTSCDRGESEQLHSFIRGRTADLAR